MWTANSRQTANIILAKCEQQVIENCPTVHKSIAILPHRFDSLHVCIQLQMNTQPLRIPKLIWRISNKTVSYPENSDRNITHCSTTVLRQHNAVYRFPYKILLWTSPGTAHSKIYSHQLFGHILRPWTVDRYFLRFQSLVELVPCVIMNKKSWLIINYVSSTFTFILPTLTQVWWFSSTVWPLAILLS